MHPFKEFTPDSKCGDWVEVSVCGAIFQLNNSKLIPLANLNNQVYNSCLLWIDLNKITLKLISRLYKQMSSEMVH